MYWVQDKYEDREWASMWWYPTEEAALAEYAKIIADPAWLHNGRRKWRVVQRINAIIVSQEDE